MEKNNIIFDIGYLASFKRSSMSSFKERSSDASKIGVRLCLIELTLKNLNSIKNKKDIDVRVWKKNEKMENMEMISISIPKIIYDRTPVAHLTGKEELFIEALIYHGCIFSNSPEVRNLSRDKWAQFRFFSTRGIRIPLTIKYNPRELNSFIKKGIVFIKPRSGSQGKKQIIIKKNKDGCFKITSTFGQRKSQIIIGLNQVKKYLQNFSLDANSYIIQEGVKIDHIEEETSRGIRLRSYDFRVIVQLNTKGKPIASIIFVRVGPPSSDQANISQGGHAQDPESVFENYQEVISNLTKLATDCFNTLAKSFTVIEMAFDFVMDETGNYWLLEINSRPGTSGPRTLREWNPKDSLYARKGVILFGEEGKEYSNHQRRKWGARFNSFRILPFKYLKSLLLKEMT